ncbi:MAG TPA: SMP-30/gluconolactonase/LRE family protein [Candidatus Acidoferrum sp.]|nr:SMP-30/gluconolactonase/LRE family protein [Candidatus Acidoferrum sp.]
MRIKWKRSSTQWQTYALSLACCLAMSAPRAQLTLQTGERTDANSKTAHIELIDKLHQGRIDLYFAGDSITRRWGTSDPAYKEMLANWRQNFLGWNAADFGWGGDTVQNILWRLQNGELRGANPKVIVLMAGTNNLGDAVTDPLRPVKVTEVVTGIRQILDTMRQLAPQSTVLLMGITPRNGKNGDTSVVAVINDINQQLATLADGKRIRYLNINAKLADANGKLFDGMTVDGLHLSVRGYQVWADALQPQLVELLGPKAKVDLSPPPSGDPSARVGNQLANAGIVPYSDKLNALIDPAEPIKLVVPGFKWSEGPVWIDDADGGSLLFSDVPDNKIYRLREEGLLSIFLDPSGFEGKDASAFREPGTNGLLRYDATHILAANHGQRQLTLIDLQTRQKTPLVTYYNGKRFNSPNDVALAKDGSVYFTDPPYGLAGIEKSPLRELPFSGVFRYGKDGKLTLIDDSLSFPNGVGVFPDGRHLLISSSDPRAPIWKLYTLDAQGKVLESRQFADASEEVRAHLPGAPDGLKIDKDGNVFASGPGGIHIFSSQGELLGIIRLPDAAANMAFGGNSAHTLFITAGTRLMKVETRTRGQ